MIHKNLIKIIHHPTINPLTCVNKYPWGFLPQKYIDTLLNRRKYSSELDEDEFKKGCYQAYYTVFDYYKKKQNFFNRNMTTPSLSISLNYFANKNTQKIEYPIVENINLLDVMKIREYTSSNDKILGLWNAAEIKTEFYNGMLGPEKDLFLCNMPYKQIVIVHFECKDRNDIWILERNLDNGDWQINNINNVLII
jgi:hypothetical protein